VGDDTFVVILPETKSRDAEEMMNRVDAHLQAHPAEIQDDPVQLGLNYGIAALKDRGVKTPEQLLKKAEQAELTRKKRSEKKRKKSSDQKVIELNRNSADKKKT
jgi:diguanylate cyclase (GGDEF)-like protein